LLLVAMSGGFSQTFTAYTSDDGLVDNWVNGVAVDSDNVKWFATQSGVSSFDGTTWTTYTTADGLVYNDAKCIAIDNDQNIWVGTDFGACKFNGTTWTTYSSADGLVNDGVTYIAVNQDGKIWFATYGGLSILDGTTWTNYTTLDGMSSDLINFIAFAPSDLTYIGTFGDGFMTFDGSSFVAYNTDNGLIDNAVTSIVFEGSNVWVSTLYGVSRFTDEPSWAQNYIATDGLYYAMVRDMLVDDFGHIWFAIYADYILEGGLTKYNGTDWITYTQDQGVTGVIMKRLAKDINGNIWVATGDGVTEINLSVNAPLLSDHDNLTFFPNPSNDVVNFSFAGNITGISVSDISGNIVATLSGTDKNLDITGFAPGLYFINYIENNTPKSQKLVVY